MSVYENALELLKRDYIKNYCVLELLRQSKNHEITVWGNSVLIRLLDGKDSFTMISSADRAEGLELVNRLGENDRNIFHVGEFPGDTIINGKKVIHFAECVQYYLPDEIEADADTSGVIPLDPGMAPYIHEHYEYKHIMSVKYIEDRIKAGPAFGIMADGKLAAWVMTHEEGTMGVLQVLPEYRRKGFATKIDWALIKSLRLSGKPCISHIVKGNTASLEASKKMGFKYSCDVQWIVFG